MSASIELEDLVCPGCGEPVDGDSPIGWTAADGPLPEFSHTDGTPLCGGNDPIEAGQEACGRHAGSEARAMSTMSGEGSPRDQILRECGPILLAALEDAADARIERTEASCPECVQSPDQLCETHSEDRAR